MSKDEQGNLLTASTVAEMAAFSNLLQREAADFSKMCWRIPGSNACMLPESLLPLIYVNAPEQLLPSTITPAEPSAEQLDSGIALAFKNKVYGYCGPEWTPTHPTTNLFRVQFNLGFPLTGYDSYWDRRQEQFDKEREWEIENVLPAIRK